MSSPIRALHILDHSLPVLSGYSTRSHHALRAQRNVGVSPVALTSPKHGSAESDATEIDGITYYRTPAPQPSGLRAQPVVAELDLMRRVARRLRDVQRRCASQVLHAHSPVLNGIPALWVGRSLGLPVVYEIRAFWEDAAVDHGTHREGSPRYRAVRALETWVMRRADAVGVISHGLGDEVRRRGISQEKLYYIPNGVDTERFHPLPRDPELTRRWNLEGRVVIAFIGSFYHYEGLDVLVDAWAQAAPQVPNATLLLIGSGEVAANVAAQVERLGVTGQTVLTGALPHAEIGAAYSVCDLLVYPRKSMRLTELVTPLKPLEAMAAGRAVLASDVGGLRELIRHGETGMLFPADDVGALARTLVELVHDSALRERLAAAGREDVIRTRNWNHLVQVHADTYTSLLHGRVRH